ncbi:MAG: caspase family protein [Pseudomonadales bacterium]
MRTSNSPISRVASGLICFVLLMPSTVVSQEVDRGAAVRQFEVVPCLLPSRIRKLGNMTYPERRRLIETSAIECELKGGEYTFYDRAAPDSAAAFFRKLADQGNVDAQVSLGDVYQYLYAEPDYEQAATWYRTAMENGSPGGQMRLARLYERGLGVPKDGLMATNLWRQATGSGEELVLASDLERARTQADERIAELTVALRQRSEEVEETRAELALTRQQIEERKASLAAAEAELGQARARLEQAGAGGESAPLAGAEEIAALRDHVSEQQRRIEDQRYQIDALQADLGVREAELAAGMRQAQLQNERLSKELERVTTKADDELQSALATVDAREQQVARLQAQVQSAETELSQTRAEYQAVVEQLDGSRASTAEQEGRTKERMTQLQAAQTAQRAKLDSQSAELEALRADLAAAAQETRQLKSSLDRQVHATAEAEAQFVAAEAELQRARDQMGEVNRELDGANARLAQLQEERASLQRQLAESAGDREAQDLQRQLLARTDQMQSQRDRIEQLEATVNRFRDELAEISLRRASYAKRTPMEDTSDIRLPADVKIGRYFSLIIGNYDYEYLNDLENAGNDAKAVDYVLREEYGFDSTLLINATQDQIFQAFDDLSTKTTENDLVLIYYAGHGYEIKNESFWLPVELQSRRYADIGGISSLKVANWVRAIPAKHVMIIADSCYSGSGIETTGGFRYSAGELQDALPFFLKSRSRTMLTSGGLAPVMDGDGSGGEFSIFTKELIGLLRENRGVIYGEALYDHLVERVKYTPDGTAVNQTPMFGTIESAGHECGQFVLVRPNLRV